MLSKPNNIIGNLRRKYEPHMKLEAKVDLNHDIIHKIDLKLRDLPKIHKTLSKSFGMQRKTLMRVLALEKKVAEVEVSKEVIEEAAEELEQDIRPYLSLVTPENVLDWNFKREVNGKYYLDYLKIREEVDKDGGTYFRLWFPDRIETIYAKDDRSDPTTIDTADNQIGRIPADILYNSKSHKKGLGISDLADIADLQKSIYNEFSEIEQLIRLTNHPSLVKTPSVNASAGAGAVIEMPEEMEPNLKPYLLQPSGQNLQGLMQSINHKVESINRIAHTGAVRTTKQAVSSGIALQTEFELLNARYLKKQII